MASASDLPTGPDWGQASVAFDEIQHFATGRDLPSLNEAQTRFDVIDRLLREVLGWRFGQIDVEEHLAGDNGGYVDYTLRVGDVTIVVEAKRVGSSFPSPTRRRHLKLNGSALGNPEVVAAISQAEGYARTKHADLVVVTNGQCWLCFTILDRTPEDFASVFFPFSHPADAEALFRLLGEEAVQEGSLLGFSNQAPRAEDRLLALVRDSDGRVDRNNIADHITPALNNALYADALLSNIEALEKCFIETEARAKFDSMLGMHLNDPKPAAVAPARRIKTGKQPSDLGTLVELAEPGFPPPVTLIIGPVGAGKSTYLRHFEKLAGRDVITTTGAHWIYVDFEQMGRGGNPRAFLYGQLRSYLLREHPNNPTDFRSLVQPAYESEIAGLARGPLAPVFLDKTEFNRRVADHIQKDFEQVEPYVDKLIAFVSARTPCIVVLDNSDLYEDDSLETSVFAEGLALSKRIHCHVIACIRDRTFVRHKADSSFDAYELRKLWLDPPPFRAVLSARLAYARKILEGKSAQVLLTNGMHLSVPDLSVFFDIVQRSTLQGEAGQYIEAVADLNIRHGLQLVTNLLTSGHIQADRALSKYIQGDTRYSFPFHEIFKGTMLGQWKHYREDRAECPNLFDSHLGSHRLRLLRLHLLASLVLSAQSAESVEVAVADCLRVFGQVGASESHVIMSLGTFQKHGMIRTIGGDAVGAGSVVAASRSGGYYLRVLAKNMAYVEACLLDTAIDETEVWSQLGELTTQIEHEGGITSRMELRQQRMDVFLRYLKGIEDDLIGESPELVRLSCLSQITDSVTVQFTRAVASARKRYGNS